MAAGKPGATRGGVGEGEVKYEFAALV